LTERTAIDPLADAAVADVVGGMVVGLGTGRTASRGIEALARRVRESSLDVRCVSTSEASERLARGLGLNVIDFSMIESVDYLFDGADEVDGSMRMIKGAGGAMTRERIVAHASRRCVYMVQREKIVERLGTRSALPVAVLAFGLCAVRAELRRMGLNGVVRRTIGGDLFVTDNGNLVIDVSFDDHDVEELALQLDRTPGVIDHGLFLTEADEILVDGPGGIERLVREGVAEST
jgi:ribose 5-phosphate isomerase A